MDERSRGTAVSVPRGDSVACRHLPRGDRTRGIKRPVTPGSQNTPNTIPRGDGTIPKQSRGTAGRWAGVPTREASARRAKIPPNWSFPPTMPNRSFPRVFDNCVPLLPIELPRNESSILPRGSESRDRDDAAGESRGWSGLRRRESREWRERLQSGKPGKPRS